MYDPENLFNATLTIADRAAAMLPQDWVETLSKHGFRKRKDLHRIRAPAVNEDDRRPGSVSMPHQHAFDSLDSYRLAPSQPVHALHVGRPHAAAQINGEADSTDGPCGDGSETEVQERSD